MQQHKKLLIIGFVWPEPNSSAAGSRMMQLIHIFLKAEYAITFASNCAKTANAYNLSSIGVAQATIELNSSSFDEFIVNLAPNVVMFDRFMTEEQFGWRVAANCPNALRVLDTEDLHCLRKGRTAAVKANQPFTNTYLFTDVAKREIASIYRCDSTLVISEAEMELLINTFKVPEELLYYLPFLLEAPSVNIDGLPPYTKRQHFVTIGNFLHEPNLDAVRYLKSTLWPLIRKSLPKAEMHVYGAYESEKVTQLTNKKEGFYCKGFAESVDEVMQQAKVCLAPLRFGAGLKGKLVDAMQNGTPCVMSMVAAEGMFGNISPNGYVTTTDAEFVEKAVALYTNEAIWSQFSFKGFEVLKKRFLRETFEYDFIASVTTLIEDLEDHRLQNFTGAMLQHHSMQSTRYMSKWIEAKNAKA